MSFGVAVISIAIALHTILSLQGYYTLPLMVIGIILTVSPILLRKTKYFDQIIVKYADVYIDTSPLRDYIHGLTSKMEPPLLEVSITFALTYGHGGIRNEIMVEWTDNADDSINRLWPDGWRPYRRLQLVHEQETTELKTGISREFHGSSRLIIHADITRELLDAFEEFSNRLEEGHFRIIWQTALWEKKVYKPKIRNY